MNQKMFRVNPFNFLDSLENYSKEIKMKYKILSIKNGAGFNNNLFDLIKNNTLVKSVHNECKFIDYGKNSKFFFIFFIGMDIIEYPKGKPDDINIMRNGFENVYEYVWN